MWIPTPDSFSNMASCLHLFGILILSFNHVYRFVASKRITRGKQRPHRTVMLSLYIFSISYLTMSLAVVYMLTHVNHKSSPLRFFSMGAFVSIAGSILWSLDLTFPLPTFSRSMITGWRHSLEGADILALVFIDMWVNKNLLSLSTDLNLHKSQLGRIIYL